MTADLPQYHMSDFDKEWVVVTQGVTRKEVADYLATLGLECEVFSRKDEDGYLGLCKTSNVRSEDGDAVRRTQQNR